MGGRTSGSGEICEAGVGVVEVKDRVHCWSGLGALRQACRSDVAMAVVGVERGQYCSHCW